MRRDAGTGLPRKRHRTAEDGGTGLAEDGGTGRRDDDGRWRETRHRPSGARTGSGGRVVVAACREEGRAQPAMMVEK